MVKANNHEVNVDELKEKIQEEVAIRQSYALSASSKFSITAIRSTIDFGTIEALINNAESRAYVRTKWPDKLKRFPFNISKKFQKLILKVLEIIFKDQYEVNFNLLQALRKSLLFNRQLIEQLATLQAQVSAVDNRMSAIDERVRAMDNRLNAIDERVRTMDERHIKDYSYIKNDLAQQKRLINLFLEEAHQRLPEPFNQEQLQTLVNEEQHLLDAFYVAFEEQFRGRRDEIIDRLKVYLPLIQKANVGTQNSPILDVGCGHGEWLELLHESGYTAHGLDINRVMINKCKARGLEAIEGDVISYLQSLPDANLGAVTGFHVIEHLPFQVLLKLFDETVRVLKPGGVAIFETPNPDNLLVSSSNFYVDPTHLNPLPSPLMKFVAEARGLHQVKILKLHLYPEQFRVYGSDVAERFNDYFYGPQDYAVIGYKL